MLIPLLRRHLAPYRGALALVVLFQLAQSVASLYLPGLNADIIDDGVVKGDVALIWRTGGVMVLVTLVQAICTIVAVYIGAKVAMSLGRDLRARVFDAVEGFAAQELAHFGAPTLITRATNDVQQVQLLTFLGLTFLVTSPIMAVGGVVMALRQDVTLSGLIVLVLPVLVVSVGFIVRALRPLFRSMQERIDDLNDVMREQIQGIRVIRAFVTEQREMDRFDRANQAYVDVAVAAGKVMALMFPTVMLIMNVSVVLATGLGGYFVGTGDLQVGTLTAFQNYLVLILMSVMMATFLLMIWPRAEVAAERITEVVRTEPSISRPLDADDAPIARGVVEIRDATFAYPGAEEDVLHGVDLLAEPGGTTAVIGSTGSGKSTLLSLVPRLFDVTGGDVLLDGRDVRSMAPETVWQAVGLVPQNAFLFSGTVASNLRYGRPDATDGELWEALEVAQARDVVETLPEGLDAPVSQGGVNFSGGQRQRLAIARAVVKRPLVYLFDDSFSALDYATDAALRSALRPITRDAAVITVAQRVATIRHADRILVLEAGEIVGTGTHAELMDACEVYREIVLSQLSEEEAR
ncbi:ABC transporter ATP-binding protein [Aeromicrobium sp. CF4.19]|uniref:ABC transporter ATP-binding protein n=1 Tax=Aeromicrobium sp. CF4.19 TaxID=3373082 RepID=UPI003EE70E33